MLYYNNNDDDDDDITMRKTRLGRALPIASHSLPKHLSRKSHYKSDHRRRVLYSQANRPPCNIALRVCRVSKDYEEFSKDFRV